MNGKERRLEENGGEMGGRERMGERDGWKRTVWRERCWKRTDETERRVKENG